jgi:hypothetical protein
MNTPENSPQNLLDILNNIQLSLQNFSSNVAEGGNLLAIAFGEEYDRPVATSILTAWNNGDFSQIPTIQIIDGSILNGANAGYATVHNTIYISDTFLLHHPLESITEVLLEEIGHWFDAQVNDTDTSGDEGELFAAQVLGKPLTAQQLKRIKSEDDTATIYLDGVAIEIEQSTAYPDYPWIIGSYKTPNYAQDIQIVGSYAYIADRFSGIQIIDISNTQIPTFVGKYDTPSFSWYDTYSNAQDVEVVDNYAYIADSQRGLQILNISNPATNLSRDSRQGKSLGRG